MPRKVIHDSYLFINSLPICLGINLINLHSCEGIRSTCSRLRQRKRYNLTQSPQAFSLANQGGMISVRFVQPDLALPVPFLAHL